jgi:hypothetical protein
MASTSVVLPWSTWAMMAMLRMACAVEAVLTAGDILIFWEALGFAHLLARGAFAALGKGERRVTLSLPHGGGDCGQRALACSFPYLPVSDILG